MAKINLTEINSFDSNRFAVKNISIHTLYFESKFSLTPKETTYEYESQTRPALAPHAQTAGAAEIISRFFIAIPFFVKGRRTLDPIPHPLYL
jgi:hypothetical protein